VHQELGKEIKQRMLIVRAVCASMMTSLFVLVGLSFVLIPEVDQLDKMVPTILACFGVIELFVASFVRKLIFRPKLQGDQAEVVKSVLETYTVSTFVAFAFWESAGIFGFVATFLSGDPIWCQALSGLAFLAMLFGWPKMAHIKEKLPMSVHILR